MLPPEPAYVPQSETELKVLQALESKGEKGGVHINDVARRSGLGAAQVAGTLTMLHLGDVIEETHPNTYALKKNFAPEVSGSAAKWEAAAEKVTPAEIGAAASNIEAKLQERKGEMPEPVRTWAKGQVVRVFGRDPTQKYDLQYRVIELDELKASHTLGGTVNAAYPAELQPRDRGRMASIAQIKKIAQNLEPAALLTETHALDRGAPIVGSDLAVESGNARSLAVTMAYHLYPEQYAAYRDELGKRATDLGIDEGQLGEMTAPVLVRERITDVDRVEFAREANQSTVLAMSTLEQAKSDAKLISTEMLEMLEVGETQDVSGAVRSGRNRQFVNYFMQRIPETEAAAMQDSDGGLSQEGVKRITAAMFTRVFEDDRLAARMYETTDDDIKNITGGYFAALGKLARAEELVKTGKRGAELSIAPELARAAEKYSELRAQGMGVQEYLAQIQIFERELTAFEEKILVALDERKRSKKAIKALIAKWADLVERSPAPNQQSFLSGDPVPTKAELAERWLQDDQEELPF